jgi:ATP synthase I chain
VRAVLDSDQGLRQFELDAAVSCGVMAVLALVVGRGRPDGAAGVLAGGALMALSYWAIKGGVDLVVAGGEPRRRIGLAVKFFTRYALLAVGAYVMLTCFRVHPIGLLAGATTPFVAALVQLVRSSRATSRRKHP